MLLVHHAIWQSLQMLRARRDESGTRWGERDPRSNPSTVGISFSGPQAPGGNLRGPAARGVGRDGCAASAAAPIPALGTSQSLVPLV